MKQIIKQATQNILLRINWKVYKPTLFSIITFLSIIPCVIFLPERFARENSLVENTQVIVLSIMLIFALRTQVYKHFFNWIAQLSVILLLREVNCGRTLFPELSIYNKVNIFNLEIRPTSILLFLYIVYVCYYFIRHRLFKVLTEYVRFAKLDIYDILLGVFGLILAELSEFDFTKSLWWLHNNMTEEMCELLFYVAITNIVYLYGHHREFQPSPK